MKILRWSLLSAAIVFLVVPTNWYATAYADFTPPGMSQEDLMRFIERSSRDFDGDGINDQNDDCPQEYGTSSYQYRGCPDADGDSISDKIDICPNSTDHKQCLSDFGLWTFPWTGGISTCKELSDYKTTLTGVKWLLIGTATVTGLVGVTLKVAVTVTGAIYLAASGQTAGAVLASDAASNVGDVYRKVCE